ncbi:MAG: BCD family MFS transporter, partial [Beijerinckiaceae bacterium]|nr:BCD family MFS transporter [Beijerinckiaceae bacterium]
MAAPERSAAPLSWLGIVRLGLVQTALGAIFVLATTTLNRVMVIELALPAVLPGALIAFHYAMQVLRPRLGHGSDVGGRRTPWILGGMAVLAAGGFSAACATALMRTHLALGIALAVPAFVAIGLGVGAAGTALLVLIAKRTAPERRPAAATIAWVMMIVGFIVTAGVAGKLLAPFSPQRLIETSAAISGIGFLVTCLAVLGVEGRAAPSASDAPRESFAAALRQVWSEPLARRFAIFVFVSMLAYGGEDLLIEPFAGALFGLGAGETAKLTGLLHAGALAGMIAVPLSAGLLPRWRGETAPAARPGPA